MLRVIIAFFVVISAIIALWGSGIGQNSDAPDTGIGVPMIQGDELILVSEVDASQLLSRQPQELEFVAVQELEPVFVGHEFSDETLAQRPAAQCVVLSSFYFRDEADALADQVRSLGVEVEIRVDITETQGSIMVYIEPFVSAQEAQRELRVLRASGVDSFIISGGELTNGISLGVFNTRQNALTQQARIEGLGYSVETNQFTIEEEHFSLIASGDVLMALAADYWLKIANENKDISIEQKGCNEVAS